MGQRSGTGQRASPGCCLPQRCGVKWPCPGANKCPFPLVLSHPHYGRRTWVCRRRPLFWKSLPWSRAQGGSSPTPARPLWDVVSMPRFAWRKRGETAVVGLASPAHPAASVWGRGARCHPRPSLLDGGALVLLWAVGFSRAFCFAFLFVQSGRPGLVPAHESSGGGLPPSPPTRHQMGGGGRAPWSSRVSARSPQRTQRHHFAQCERPFLLARSLPFYGASEREEREKQEEPLSEQPRGGRSPATPRAAALQGKQEFPSFPPTLVFNGPRDGTYPQPV